MKRFFTLLCCALVSFLCVLGLSACTTEKDEEAVNLVAITGVQVGVTDGIDYYVVPEPAASTKAAAVEGLEFVGDLQQLYGGENGYPQAVVVAKNQLLDSTLGVRFLNELNKNGSWLLEADAQTITSAVQSRLTEGMTPTFNANNLTEQVIKNCGVRLTNGVDDKQEIIEFMQKINSVSDQSFGTPSDAFFDIGEYPEGEYEGKVTVYAPDGAPALGLARLIAENVAFGESVETEYNIVDSTLIQTYVTGANPAADICVLPVNVAVKLLGTGEKYKLLGTLTHGNLFILSKDGTQITGENLSVLKGKTVGVVNLAAVPGLTLKLILKNNGLEYVETV